MGLDWLVCIWKECQEGPKMSKRQNKKICLIQPCGHCYDNVICFYLELPATFPGTLLAQKFLKILLIQY